MKYLFFLPLASLLILCGCDEPQVRIEASPPAAVWNGDLLLGQTPITIALPETEQTLTLRSPGFHDATLTVAPDQADAPLPPTILKPMNSHNLICTSEPTGAQVFIEGEFRGLSPLTVRNISEKTVEVAFRLKNHRQQSQSVDFSEETTRSVSVILESLTEEYYLKRLRAEPGVIHHHCDLLHHYVMENDFNKAMGIITQGIELLVSNPGTPDESRFWSEVNRITTRQYNYGDAQVVAKAQRLLAKTLDADLRKHSGAAPLNLFTETIGVLDAVNQRQRAQEVFDEAWKKFPSHKYLRRLARQKHFTIP